jgi:hypothetical protein
VVTRERLSRAFWIASCTARGTEGRIVRIGTTAAPICRAISVTGSEDVNGGSPASSS